ncbi:hypothetical protein [Gordonia amicalis]|uniref:hypothetical protein n=1 Tax=Gordonia amicalis TaxID=89053 RepID=UPI0024BBD504|nr:hypothetical protein [Gordonia amicalis]MDJ0454374.1 hypothetical protein [Gordonia amicalis]MDV7077737.1 hypothetical protein [Gordonia amicalis]
MSFTHYSEPASVVADGNRKVLASLGEVAGLELAYLAVESPEGAGQIVLTIPELRTVSKALQELDPEWKPSTGGYYLYRVVITKYPEGALGFYTDDSGETFGYVDTGWEPEGWNPDEEYVSQFGGRQFHWPSTKREYKSLSSARARAKLIESYGATAVVERSTRIEWPEETR